MRVLARRAFTLLYLAPLRVPVSTSAPAKPASDPPQTCPEDSALNLTSKFWLHGTCLRSFGSQAESEILAILWPLARPKYCKKGVEFIASKAMLVESGIFQDIWNVQTFIFLISDPNWIILNNFCRNYSFTRPGGWIIGSNRSGTCFSSCLTLSKYFSLNESMFL